MPKKISLLRKNTLYFLSLFNAITLPLIVILFVVFIFLDVPLKYLFWFIAVYTLSKWVSIMLSTEDNAKKDYDVPKEYSYIWLAIVNVMVLIFLSLLIDRYELHAYSIETYSLALLMVNGAFLEFTYHFISHFMNTRSGAWVGRTLLLLVWVGIWIFGMNMMRSSPPPTVPSTPKKTFSEVTGIISTIDTSVDEESDNATPLSGSQVANISEPITVVANTTSEKPKKNTSPEANEVSGTLNTLSDLQANWIRIDSIESVDGRATATLKDGKITVQVVKPEATTTGALVTDGWKVRSSIQRKKGAGWLQWVVISAPYALPVSGTHATYQSIILTADWASWIFFTIDGSEPSCDGKWLVETITDKKVITVKAISCFWDNKIRWPIAIYWYTLGN